MGLETSEKELLTRIPLFSSQHLEAACRVLAYTERGLSETQIERLLQEVEVADPAVCSLRWGMLLFVHGSVVQLFVARVHFREVG